MKDHLITLAIVIVGVLAAHWIAGKIGLNSYDEFEASYEKE